MNRYPIWKYVIIVIMLLLGTIYSLPNLYGEAPAVQVSPGKATVKLDNASLSKVESLLQAEGLQAGMIQMEGHSIKARFDDTTAQLKARDALEKPSTPTLPSPTMWWRSTCCPALRPGCKPCMPTPCTWGWICAVVFTSCCKWTWPGR